MGRETAVRRPDGADDRPVVLCTECEYGAD